MVKECLCEEVSAIQRNMEKSNLGEGTLERSRSPCPGLLKTFLVLAL